MDALDKIGKALKESGVSLEEFIERGREIRGEIVEGTYANTDSEST
jgi:hypothetical protein